MCLKILACMLLATFAANALTSSETEVPETEMFSQDTASIVQFVEAADAHRAQPKTNVHKYQQPKTIKQNTAGQLVSIKKSDSQDKGSGSGSGTGSGTAADKPTCDKPYGKGGGSGGISNGVQKKLADAITEGCKKGLEKQTWGAKVCTLIKDQAIVKLLEKASEAIPGFILTDVTSNGVYFVIKELPVGLAKFMVIGEISFMQDVLHIHANNCKKQNVAKHVAMESLALDIQVNTKTKTLVGSSGSATVEVTIGKAVSTGTVVVDYSAGKSVKATATLMTKQLKLGAAVTINAGSIIFKYADNKLNVDFAANADIKLASTSLSVVMSGSYDGATGTFTFDGKMDTMVNQIIPGVEFISGGKLKTNFKLTNGDLDSMKLSGVLCVGAKGDCSTGTKTAKNVIANLVLDYVKASDDFQMYASAPTVKVSEIVMAVSGQVIADKVPKPLADVSMSDFLFAYSKKATTINKVAVTAGVTINASVNLESLLKLKPADKNKFTFYFTAPDKFSGIKIPIPGTQVKDAKWVVSLTGLGQKAPLISFGQKTTGSPGLAYAINFKTAVLIVLKEMAQDALADAVNTEIDKVEKFLKDNNLTFDILRGEKLAYFGAKGGSTVGQLGVYCLVQKSPLALVGAVSVDTQYFGKLLMSLMDSKTNPFAKMPIMSNVAVALYFSTANVKLPKDALLPKPFEDITDLKKGFCLKGALKAPTESCQVDGKPTGMSALCDKVKTLLGANGQIALSACVSPSSIKFEFSVQNLKLSDAATMNKASFYIDVNPKNPSSFELGATVEVTLPINKSPVTFGGALTFTFASMSVGFKLYMKGLLPKAFGVDVLNLNGLEFGASIMAAPPYLSGLQIGGGLCLGTKAACEALVKTAELTAQAALLQKINDEPVPFGSKRALELGWDKDWLDHTGASPKLVEVDAFANTKTHAVMFKCYIGFSLPASFYFYASMSKTTVAQLVSAVGASVQMPDAIGNIEVAGYDGAETAFISFATQEETIASQKNMVIPQGLSVSGSLTIYGYKTGLKLNIDPLAGKFSGTILFPAFKLAGCQVSRTKAEPKKGPTMSVDIDVKSAKFSGSMQVFMDLGVVGSIGVSLKVGSTGMEGMFTLNAFKLIEAEVQFEAGIVPATTELLQVENSVVTADGQHTAFKDEHQHALLQEQTGDDLQAALKTMRGGMTGATKFALGFKTKGISDEINKLAKTCIEPLETKKKEINAFFDKVSKYLDEKSKELKGTQDQLEDARKSCTDAENAVKSKKASCNFEELEQLRLKHGPNEPQDPRLAVARRAWAQTLVQWQKRMPPAQRTPTLLQVEDCNGSRAYDSKQKCGHCSVTWGSSRASQYNCEGYWKCWYLGCYLTKGAIEVAWAAKQTARSACRLVIDGLAATANGICQAGITIAQKALGLVQSVVEVAQKVVNNVRALLNTILDKITNTLKWLGSFVLNFVGFATNGFTGGDFAFIAKLTFDSQPKEYKFNYNMQKDGSILSLATKVFTESVKKAFTAAWDWIVVEVKKLFALDTTKLVDLVELKDDESRAAAAHGSISLEQFINAKSVRSTALAHGSSKKKLTHVLMHMNGRDYLMKTRASSLAEIQEEALSRPMDSDNAHWHLNKQSEQSKQDMENRVQHITETRP